MGIWKPGTSSRDVDSEAHLENTAPSALFNHTDKLRRRDLVQLHPSQVSFSKSHYVDEIGKQTGLRGNSLIIKGVPHLFGRGHLRVDGLHLAFCVNGISSLHALYSCWLKLPAADTCDYPAAAWLEDAICILVICGQITLITFFLVSSGSNSPLSHWSHSLVFCLCMQNHLFVTCKRRDKKETFWFWIHKMQIVQKRDGRFAGSCRSSLLLFLNIWTSRSAGGITRRPLRLISSIRSASLRASLMWSMGVTGKSRFLPPFRQSMLIPSWSKYESQ